MALRDGSSMRRVAKSLGVDDKTVRLHAKDLIKRGVLAPSGRGWGFKRGPKAKPYEDSIPSRRNTDRVGSVAGAPEIAIRVHRGGVAFEVRGPVARVPWAHSWEASGVPNHEWWDDAGNRYWLVQPKGAPARLMVQPVEEFVYDSAELPALREARRARVRELAQGFMEQHRLKFASDGAFEFQPIEYAAEMPGLEAFGEPGRSFVWVDGSPGEGRMEIETSDPKMAALLLEWPTIVREVEQARQVIGMLVQNEKMLLQVLTPKPGKPAKPLPPELDPGVA